MNESLHVFAPAQSNGANIHYLRYFKTVFNRAIAEYLYLNYGCRVILFPNGTFALGFAIQCKNGLAGCDHFWGKS